MALIYKLLTIVFKQKNTTDLRRRYNRRRKPIRIDSNSLLAKVILCVAGVIDSIVLFIVSHLIVVISIILVLVIVLVVALNSFTEDVKMTGIFDSNLNLDGGSVTNQINGGSFTTGTWSEHELAVRGTNLTDYEKNQYRLVMLAFDEAKKKENIVPYQQIVGIYKIESGGAFFTNTKDNVNSILDTVTTKNYLNNGSNCYGIFQIKGLRDKRTSTYTVKNNLGVASEYWGNSFMPYAIQNVYELYISKRQMVKNMDALVNETMQRYGMSPNNTRLKEEVMGMMAGMAYWGYWADRAKYVLEFTCAMLGASGETDDARSIDNWSLDYSDNGAVSHRKFFGDWTKNDKNIKSVADIKGTGEYIKLNGNAINKPVIVYLYDKYKTNSYFNTAMEKYAYWSSNLTGHDWHQHTIIYANGIEHRLLGNAIIRDIRSKLTGYAYLDGTPEQNKLEMNSIYAKIELYSNSFYRPVDKVVVSSQFGWRAFMNNGKVVERHAGVDLTGKSGTQLFSSVDGVVIGVGTDGSRGNYIIIRDNVTNFKLTYMHLRDKSHLKKNAKVKKAELVGSMGTTGNSTGVHLHYQIEDDSFTKSYVINPSLMCADIAKASKVYRNGELCQTRECLLSHKESAKFKDAKPRTHWEHRMVY